MFYHWPYENNYAVARCATVLAEITLDNLKTALSYPVG
jgi:hypothetical protein